MKVWLVSAVLFCGCSGGQRVDLLCECFSGAAYEVYRAELRPMPPAGKCCDACKGTGKVRSGDGLAVVPCPCPPTCRCKQ